MSEINSQNLEAIINAVVQKVLAERQTSSLAQNGTPSAGKILVGICCGECLNNGAQSALEALKQANFALHQPEESTFKKLADREKLVAESDGVLLPSLGDDDAAKMAMGIFDEPVARLALTALASDKPVWAAIHSPYDEAIKRRAPQLHRVWEGHKKLLESYGIQVVPYSELAAAVTTRLQKSKPESTVTGSKTLAPTNGKKVLITVKEVEAAAKDGARLRLPAGALVTPLARDRARELGVNIG